MAQSNFPQTLGYVDPYAAQIEAARARLAQPVAPMYSPQEIAQRRAENERQMQLGLLGQLSGDESLSGVGGQVLKQALSGRQARVTDRGTFDPLSGEFKSNPAAQREREEQSLSLLEQKAAAARAAYDEARRKAEERAELARERMDFMLAIKKLSAAQGQVGNYTPAGFAPTGEQVVTNSKTGVNYTVRVGPDGQPQYTTYMGAYTPKTTFDKQVVEAGEQLTSAERADKLVSAVRKHPDAFGVRAAVVGAMPGPLQGWAGQVAGLTPEQRALRAAVTRDASMELNKIYGAAQSAGELARASAWAPNPSDEFETLITKLEAARDWARSQARAGGSAVEKAARTRTGQDAAGAADQSDPLGAYELFRNGGQ